MVVILYVMKHFSPPSSAYYQKVPYMQITQKKNIYEDHAIRDVDSIIEWKISTNIKPPSSYLTSKMTLVVLMHVYEIMIIRNL